jgi:hypothetical protein
MGASPTAKSPGTLLMDRMKSRLDTPEKTTADELCGNIISAVQQGKEGSAVMELLTDARSCFM